MVNLTGRFNQPLTLRTCFWAPSAAPSSAGEAGGFGHRLFEFRGSLRSVQAARASFDGRPVLRATQDTSGSWGVLSFGYFALDKQSKVTRLQAKWNVSVIQKYQTNPPTLNLPTIKNQKILATESTEDTEKKQLIADARG